MIRFKYMNKPIASFALSGEDIAVGAAIGANVGLLGGMGYNIHRMNRYNTENPRSDEQIARGQRFNEAVARADRDAGPGLIKRYEFTPEEQEDMNAFMEYENSRAKEAGTVNPFLTAGGLAAAGAGTVGAIGLGQKYFRGRK